MAASSRVIPAAGVVVFRKGPEVLVIHRPKYDDWSFPKGKLDRGEPAAVAAVREVDEETGLHVRLGRPLRAQHYPVRGGRKTVRYWVGRVAATDEAGRPVDSVAGYEPNDEVDQVAWLPVEEAAARLTYARDRRTLREAVQARKPTTPLIVLRHGDARARATWRGEDRLRPLLVAGRRQAVTVAGILAAYDVRRIVTSPSARCLQSVVPYAEDTGLPVEQVPLLSEEEAEKGAVVELTSNLLAGLGEHGGTVLCTHRPVLPWVFAGLGWRNLKLEKGELAVFHVRKGRVVALERHQG